MPDLIITRSFDGKCEILTVMSPFRQYWRFTATQNEWQPIQVASLPELDRETPMQQFRYAEIGG